MPPARSFAKHRTITELEHVRALKAQRDERLRREPIVEVRPLARYDQPCETGAAQVRQIVDIGWRTQKGGSRTANFATPHMD